MITELRQPIAIIGAACRFPEGGDNPEAFWRQLRDGVDVIKEVPPSRWDVEAYYDVNPDKPGKMYSRHGGFIERFDEFDPQFFGISPREAHQMDPQQRILLECSWEAIEDAGLNPDRLRLSQTGVFVGILSMDYMVLHSKTSGTSGIDPYFASGKEFSFSAGRVSYTLGLQGPCMSVNTACSSSLVAVHLAVQSLLTGESDVALAAGVNMITAPELTMFLCKVGALSPNGRCAVFDAAADGIVRGEGCGVVVLKRLEDALADNDVIHALIRGTAVNHNGPSAGLTVPNGKAQQALLRRALQVAGVDPLDVSFIEAHGTGTPLGDPVEIGALSAVFCKGRPKDDPLVVGSLKTNFGHMDSAAGIASVIKVMQAMKHGEIPPHLHLKSPNPLIPWDTMPIEVPRTQRPWAPQGKPRFAGINAFGLSGVNAHVLLEEPRPEHAPKAPPAADGQPVILPISARTASALHTLVAAYEDRLTRAHQQGEAITVKQVAATAAARRKHHEHRVAVIGRSVEEIASHLKSFLETSEGATRRIHDSNIKSGTDVVGKTKIVFVFSGQGSEWPGMGRRLLDQPVFREAIEAADACFKPLAGWSLIDALRASGADSKLDRTDVTQPAIFAVQIGLAALWQSWGVKPQAVIGQSFGEVAAAYIANVLTLEEAVRVIYHRGRLMQPAYGTGKMAAVGLTVDKATELIAPYGTKVSIAAMNSPTSVVLSGDAEVLRAIVDGQSEKQVFARMLSVEFPFHSAQMQVNAEALEEALAGIEPKRASIKVFSTIDEAGDDRPKFDAAYWARTMYRPVRFADGVARLLDEDFCWFIEVSPHAVLAKPLSYCLEAAGKEGEIFTSLRRNTEDVLALYGSLSAFYAAGGNVDWSAMYGRKDAPFPLPRYPFQRQRYWLAGVERGQQTRVGDGAVDLGDLLGQIRIYDRQGKLVAETGGIKMSPPSASGEIRLAEATPVSVEATALTPATALAKSQAPAAERRPPTRRVRSLDDLKAAVESLVVQALGLDPKARVKRNHGFFDMGMDSITAVELKRMLEAMFDHNLSATVAFDHPTIERLALHLLEVLPAPPDSEEAKPHPTAAEAGTADRLPGALDGVPAQAVSTAAAGDEPIAIVGIACRFPGGALSPATYWRLLADGVDGIGKIPIDRFDADALYDPERSKRGKIYTTEGGFIDGVDLFDARFFRIAPREARTMDPQQRVFLEVAWEALEDAGVHPGQLIDSATGVFVGMNSNDYLQELTKNPKNLDIYYGTGNSFCGVSGRVSYFLGLQGPSLAVDTACSSSLVAVHLACQSIHAGECDLALAGGVNIILNATVYLSTADGGALAPDGRCKTFDASADGYGRGEGCGVITLKRLSKAIEDGDRIHALILASAVNQDGPSAGLTVPNGPAQEKLIKAALKRAKVEPHDVSFVEAHGTGTPLGDPIEVRALRNALERGRPDARPLAIGSVKANIGHLEAAAGVAGLIKATLALEKHAIPPNLHFDEPNPSIPWDSASIVVPTKLTPWEPEAERRICGVSAFGFTGTNAHVVMAEPPEAPAVVRSTDVHTLLLSSSAKEGLSAQASSYAEFLSEGGDGRHLHLHDICYTASRRRTHHDHRLAVAGRTHDEIAQGLRAYATQDTKVNVITGTATSASGRRLVFVYSGYGSQWSGMARGLLAGASLFRDTMKRVDALMQRHRPGSILESLTGEGPVGLELSQEQIFAVQIGLTEMWHHHGVKPEAIVGHSMGEVAAAYAAGALSLDDAVEVICLRAHLLTRLVGKGGMGLVGVSSEEAEALVAPYGDRLCVAVSNSPTSTVLSGEIEVLKEVMASLQAKNVFCRMVKAEGAGHSAFAEPLRIELEQALGRLAPTPVKCPIYSSVTGAAAEGTDFDAGYWGRNIRRTVRFADAVKAILNDGFDAFVEVSPHPILLTPIEQGLRHYGATGVTIPTLIRDENDVSAFHVAVRAAHCHGIEVDWSSAYAAGHVVSLPPYAWQRSRYWMEHGPEVVAGTPAAGARNGAHPLLARHMRAAGSGGRQHLWEVDLDPEALPYLRQRQIEGVPLVPAEIYVEMVLAAADAILVPGLALEAIDFAAPLLLVPGKKRTLQLVLDPDEASAGARFEIHSLDGAPGDPDAPVVLRAAGRVGPPRVGPSAQADSRAGLLDRSAGSGTPSGFASQGEAARAPSLDEGVLQFAENRERFTNELSAEDINGRLEDIGALPEPVRGWRFEHLLERDGELVGEVHLTDWMLEGAEPYGVHPAILSAGFDLLLMSARSEGLRYVPMGADSMRLADLRGERFRVQAWIAPRNGDGLILGNLRFFDEAGVLRGEARGLRFAPISGKVLPDAVRTRIDRQLYEVAWRTAKDPKGTSEGRWLIVGGTGRSARLAPALAERLGASVINVGRDAAFAGPSIDGAGIVDLRGLDVDRVGDLSAVEGALALAQALRDAKAAPLWFVTAGAQPVLPRDRTPLALAQVPLWGLARVIGLEHRNLWGGLIDLDPSAGDLDQVAALVRALSAPGGEDHIAFRRGRRYVARLQRFGAESVIEPPRLHADKTYVISDALDEVGAWIGRWLVEHGARHIALVGGGAAPESVRALTAGGVEVQVYPAGLPEQVAQVLKKIRSAQPPIGGVVNAAVAWDVAFLKDLAADKLGAVVRRRALTAYAMHEHTAQDPLDLFVLFSSVASMWGAMSFGHYAAADQMLDALAHHRRRAGLPATSVCFGPFEDAGLLSQQDRFLMSQGGIEPLSLSNALEGLEMVLALDRAHAAVTEIDWGLLKKLYDDPAPWTLISDVGAPEGEREGKIAVGRALVDALQAAAVEDRMDLLTHHVLVELAVVFGFESADELEPDQGFFQMGMNSVMALQLKVRLERDIGHDLPATLVFEYSTAKAIARFLANVLGLEVAAALSPAATSDAEAKTAKDEDAAKIEAIKELSDDALAALLDEELGATAELLD